MFDSLCPKDMEKTNLASQLAKFKVVVGSDVDYSSNYAYLINPFFSDKTLNREKLKPNGIMVSGCRIRIHGIPTESKVGNSKGKTGRTCRFQENNFLGQNGGFR